jgi:hypothetical protein
LSSRSLARLRRHLDENPRARDNFKIKRSWRQISIFSILFSVALCLVGSATFAHDQLKACPPSPEFSERLKSVLSDFKRTGATDTEMTCGLLKCADVQAANCALRSSYMNLSCNTQDVVRGLTSGYIEPLILSDLLAEADASLACHLPFLNHYNDQPNAPDSVALNERAYQAYKDNYPRMRALGALQKSVLSFEVPGQEPRARYYCKTLKPKAAPTCQLFYKGDFVPADAGTPYSLATIETQQKLLTATVPYGQSGDFKEALEKMYAGPLVLSDEFTLRFRETLLQTRKDALAFSNEIKSTKVPQGKLGSSYCPKPSMRARLMSNPAYREKILTTPGLSPSLKKNLLCRQHLEFEVAGPRIRTGIVLSSIFTLGIGPATALAGMATNASMRATLIATDLSINGATLLTSLDRYYDTCYKPLTIAAKQSACSAQDSLEGVIRKTNAAECYLAAVSAAGVIAFPIAMPFVKSLRNKKRTND